MTRQPHRFVTRAAALAAMVALTDWAPPQAATSTPAVPEIVHKRAHAICHWARKRYPPLVTGTGSGPRRLWAVYRATPKEHHAWRSQPGYFDCRTRVWRVPDSTVPRDVRDCAYARDHCEDPGITAWWLARPVRCRRTDA